MDLSLIPCKKNDNSAKEIARKKYFNFLILKVLIRDIAPPKLKRKTPIQIQSVNGLNQILVVQD